MVDWVLVNVVSCRKYSLKGLPAFGRPFLFSETRLDMKVEGMIDLFFSDSDMPIREQEVRRYLPQINPFGLIVMHDASSHLKTVRDAALKLEREGLISVVLLPTPRGLVVAQRREGRR